MFSALALLLEILKHLNEEHVHFSRFSRLLLGIPACVSVGQHTGVIYRTSILPTVGLFYAYR